MTSLVCTHPGPTLPFPVDRGVPGGTAAAGYVRCDELGVRAFRWPRVPCVREAHGAAALHVRRCHHTSHGERGIEKDRETDRDRDRDRGRDAFAGFFVFFIFSCYTICRFLRNYDTLLLLRGLGSGIYHAVRVCILECSFFETPPGCSASTGMRGELST